MKTLKEYIAESKKVYSFKIKIAGELPEKFQENLKSKLDRCKVITLEKLTTTPVQKLPLDFPTLENKEVTVFEVVCEYPITSPEIVSNMKDMGLTEEYFRVRGSGEPTEIDQLFFDNESNGDALLNDSQYKETTVIKHKEYFGDDFNKSFLKDLEKSSKARKKDGMQAEYKIPKNKTDKVGANSPIGAKELR